MIVSEGTVHMFIYPVTVISIIANLALIFIILTTHNDRVGAYRYLLLSFSVVDILISIVHFTIVPAVEMTEFGFIFYGFRFIREPTEVGVVTDLIFIALFYQTFVLLDFHYVYRYVLLCNPSWLARIRSNNPWRNWLAIIIVVDVLYVSGFVLDIVHNSLPRDATREAFAPMLMESHNISLLAPNKPGFLAIAYKLQQADGSVIWSIDAVNAIIITMLLFFGSAIVILFCIWKVREEMARNLLSAQTRTMQKQLFRTLLIQARSNVVMMSTALFPLIDPFLVIFLITGYRSRVPAFLRNVSSVQPTTTSAIIANGK